MELFNNYIFFYKFKNLNIKIKIIKFFIYKLKINFKFISFKNFYFLMLKIL